MTNINRLKNWLRKSLLNEDVGVIKTSDGKFVTGQKVSDADANKVKTSIANPAGQPANNNANANQNVNQNANNANVNQNTNNMNNAKQQTVGGTAGTNNNNVNTQPINNNKVPQGINKNANNGQQIIQGEENPIQNNNASAAAINNVGTQNIPAANPNTIDKSKIMQTGMQIHLKSPKDNKNKNKKFGEMNHIGDIKQKSKPSIKESYVNGMRNNVSTKDIEQEADFDQIISFAQNSNSEYNLAARNIILSIEHNDLSRLLTSKFISIGDAELGSEIYDGFKNGKFERITRELQKFLKQNIDKIFYSCLTKRGIETYIEFSMNMDGKYTFQINELYTKTGTTTETHINILPPKKVKLSDIRKEIKERLKSNDKFLIDTNDREQYGEEYAKMANEIKGNPSTENVKIDGKKIKENKKNDKAVKISEYEEKNTKDLKKD